MELLQGAHSAFPGEELIRRNGEEAGPCEQLWRLGNLAVWAVLGASLTSFIWLAIGQGI